MSVMEDRREGGRGGRKEGRKEKSENNLTDDLISHPFPKKEEDRILFLKAHSEEFVQGVPRGRRLEGGFGIEDRSS